MFTEGLWAAAGIVFIFAMTCLGASASFLMPGHSSGALLKIMMGFSAGVMTAASVWSLLIPAMEQSASEGMLPAFLPAGAGLVLGALFIAALDLWQSFGNREKKPLLFAAVTLHNIPEGMAVGLAFALSARGEGLASALALAFGIGVQNLPEGAAVSLPLCQSGMGRSRAFLRGSLSGAVEPAAALAAMACAAVIYPAMPWFLGFAAGAMLFVSAHELLPQAGGGFGSLAFVGGFVLMMSLDVALG